VANGVVRQPLLAEAKVPNVVDTHLLKGSLVDFAKKGVCCGKDFFVDHPEFAIDSPSEEQNPAVLMLRIGRAVTRYPRPALASTSTARR
jgi:hypothetical protein